MRARYASEIGTRGWLRVYWDEVVGCDGGEGRVSRNYLNSCPRTSGSEGRGIHNAMLKLGDVPELEAWKAFGKEEDFAQERWPSACEDCGAPVPDHHEAPVAVGEKGVFLVRQVFTRRLYDTASGSPEPGDVFYNHIHDGGGCPYWDNCDGRHVEGVLPNGRFWDIDSRASNCTKPSDRSHRCWVRTGSPQDGTLSVGKSGGPTCEAGGGSILVPGWHGFLRNFSWM